ncbi:MAG: NAD-binding protein [Candidatus Eremiobacterota bacterium]
MNFIRKYTKKLFNNKYIDLAVIFIVFCSILLLTFETLSGFEINQKTIDVLSSRLDPYKLEALKTLENKRLSSDELISILEQSWLKIDEEKEFYELDDTSKNLIKKIKNDGGKTLAIIEDTKFTEEELKLTLEKLDLKALDIEKIFLHSIKSKEYLKDKISPEKLNFIKLMKFKEFREEDLKEKLQYASFNKNEIKTVISYTSKLHFNKNEIKQILKESQLIFPLSEKTRLFIVQLDDIIIAFFIIELILRYFSCDNYKIFFYRYWLDILAVIPLFRVFRLSRVFILLRLFRVMSFAVLLGRHMSFFSSVINKRWIDFFLILIFLIFVVTFGTLGLISSEPAKHPTPGNCFWTIIFSLICGEYTTEFPDTVIGKLTLLFIFIAGMSIFAILIGTVSAIMMEKFKEGIIMRKTNFDILENHIIICGWERKTLQIIKELQSSPDYKNSDIVLISDRENFINMDLQKPGVKTDRIYLMEGDFTDPNILRKANIMTAKIAIILPDKSGDRNNRDIDARTVLTALTIEKLNHNVYSCAELLDPEYESHMKMGNVNEVILGGYYSGLIAAHAAMNENIVPFLKNILPSQAENKFQNIQIPENLIGKEFGEVISELRKIKKALPVGVKTSGGELIINPSEYIMKEGDYLIGLVSK